MAAKRNRYVSENDSSSSDCDSWNGVEGRAGSKKRSKNGTKWLSRNAIMARENRLKKKMYISSLERDVQALKCDKDKLASLVDTQSALVAELRKEVKYLKSVLANSGDISNLLRALGRGTGMSVASSLDQSLSRHFSKPQTKIARKTAHSFDEHTDTPLFDDADLRIDELLGGSDVLFEDLNNIEDAESTNGSHLDEHNYNYCSSETDDVGVCLHVSKHRLSLEFCASCSDNATQLHQQ